MTSSFTSSGDSADCVIFLHGVGSGKEGWEAQATVTVDAGWRFVAVDAPGFGETPLPDQAGFKPHVERLLELINSLNANRVILCGHSLGGMTAQEFYAAYPAKVSGLILSATSSAFGKPDGDFQKEFLRARFEPFDKGMTMPEFAKRFAGNLMGPSASAKAVNQVIEVMSSVSVDAYRMSMNTIVGFDQRDNLQNIHVPTLLISGEHDRNSPAKMMARMAERILDSEYVQLSNTGHMAPIENSAVFNQHLTQFLKGLN